MKYLNEKGNALYLTILVVVFVSVIGVGLLTVTANSNKTTVNERFDQSVYYIAEAGLNLEKASLYAAMNTAYSSTLDSLDLTPQEQISQFDFTSTFNSYLCAIKQQYCDATEKQYTHFQKQFNKQPLAKTTVLKECTATLEMKCTFTIESKGTFEDQPLKTRDLVQKITIISKSYSKSDGDSGSNPDTTPTTPESPLPFSGVVAVTKGKIEIGSTAATVHGNLASNLNKVIIKKDKKFYGEVLHVSSPIDLNSYLPPFTKITVPPVPKTSNLSQIKNSDVYIENLNGNITIDIGANNRTIYVDHLNLKNGITVTGSGKLNIVVLNSMNIEGTISRTDNDPKKLDIYYQGTTKVSTTYKDNGSHMPTNIKGSIHILNSKLEIDGGNIAGNIYYHGTEELKINGNGTSYSNYLVAPNAFVQTNGNADFNGVIIAKELLVNGNHDLNASSDMLVPLPNPTPTNPTPSTPPSSTNRDPIIQESDIEEQ